MTTKQFTMMILVSAATSVGSIWGYSEYQQYKNGNADPLLVSVTAQPAKFADYAVNKPESPIVDFEKAATTATPAVVHIKTLTKAKQLVTEDGVAIDMPAGYRPWMTRY